MAACRDRRGLRGSTRPFGVCHGTVLRWVGEEAARSPAFVDTLLRAESGDRLALDELWSFVGAKAQPLWLRVALCRSTRQSAGWTPGGRCLQSACDPRASRPRGHRNRATRSGYREACAAAFPQRTRRRGCGKAAGETYRVERWLGTLRARTSRPGGAPGWFPLQAHREPLDAIHLFTTTYNLAILHKATVN